MPVPKVKRMRHKSPDEVIKSHHVMYILRGMGYDVDDARNEYSAFATKEECQELDKAVKEGKLWVTY